MKKTALLTAVLLLGLGSFSSSQAGVYTDKLSQCLARSTSPADRTDLVRWMFSAFALHPDIKAHANITAEQRAVFETRAGALFERLLVTDCRSETIGALKNEGSNAVSNSFTVLGQLAGTELATAPAVTAGVSGMVSKVDKKKISAVFKEAGVTPN